MGLMDNMKDKSQDMMDNPEQKAKIEQYAKDNNISIEDARNHIMNSKDK